MSLRAPGFGGEGLASGAGRTGRGTVEGAAVGAALGSVLGVLVVLEGVRAERSARGRDHATGGGGGGGRSATPIHIAAFRSTAHATPTQKAR
jgi:hypothetical protein